MHIKQQKYAVESDAKYRCDNCDYECSRKFLWEQHISTRKHRKRTLATEKQPKYADIEAAHVCESCGRKYKQRSGLWRHRKKCTATSSCSENNVVVAIEENDWKSVITTMVKSLESDAVANRELMTHIIQEQSRIIKDMVPRMGDTTNSVNINVFLNERCSGALNMSEFIDSLQIQLEDLDFAKSNGLVEGISTVFVSRLKQLDAFKRPIHCTDAKREVLYIKDNDEWEKDVTKEKLRGVIGELAVKHRQAISEWEVQHPDWSKSESGRDDYVSLVASVMRDVNECRNENKIIRCIAKETIIPDTVTD